MESVKKARAAIHYSLGEPTFIEFTIRQAINNKQQVKDPLLKLLIKIEETVQQISELSDREDALNQASNLIKIASEVVKAFVGEEE